MNFDRTSHECYNFPIYGGIERDLSMPEKGSLKSTKRGVVITPRDKIILKHLARTRILNTAQVATLVAPFRDSDQRIVRRLKTLRDANIVSVLAGQARIRLNPETGKYEGKNKLAYTLGNAGASLLEEYDPELARKDWNKKARELKQWHVDHSIAISWVYVTILRAIAGGPTGMNRVSNVRLENWIPECEMLQDSFYTDPQGQPIDRPGDYHSDEVVRRSVRPDAHFVMYRTDTKLYLPYFLEVDQSTMPLKRFGEKMDHYRHWKTLGRHLRWGLQSFTVLTVAKSKARRDNLCQQALDVVGETDRFCFAAQEDFVSDFNRFFLDRIWYIPGSLKPVKFLN